MRIVHEGDPGKWVCDECESMNQIPLPKLVPSKHLEDTKTRFKINKPPRNSKVQYITPEEAMVLESGATRNNSSTSKIPKRDPTGFKNLPPRFSVKPNSPIGPSNSRDKTLSTSKGKPVVHKHHAWEESPVGMGCSGRNTGTVEKDTGNCFVPHCQETLTSKSVPFGGLLKTNTEKNEKDCGHTSLQIIQCLSAVTSELPKTKKERNVTHSAPNSFRLVKGLPAVSSEILMETTSLSPPDRGKDCIHPTFPRPHLDATPLGADVCTDAQPKSIDSEGRESSKVTMKLDKFLPNHPAEFPTWKGSFKVTGDVVPCGFCDGVQAHPPSKVHSKVYEFSKQLPTMLQFELLPRLTLWVDVFEEVIPGGLDIGLYFLPSKRHEQSYTCLVEYLGQYDVLLRSCINDVELLIFSSKHLQEDSKRMNQNYFLWGVFRFMGDNMVGENRAVSSEDMDIDMIGGHDMGNVDVVIPKPAEEARVDPTKGDENEIKALAKRPTDSIIEFSPSEVEVGSLRLTSCVKDELFFERELQRSFDRFDAIMKQREAADAVGM